MIQIVKKRKISFIISTVLFITSLVLLTSIGLKPNIDFTGGTLMEIAFSEARPTVEELKASLDKIGQNSAVIQPIDVNGYIVKTTFVTEPQHQEILSTLRDSFQTGEVIEGGSAGVIVESNGGSADAINFEEVGKNSSVVKTTGNYIEEKRIETIGPAISTYLRERAWQAALLVIIAIVLFIAYAFRRVSRPVKSWKFGVTAIVALVHDMVITMGVFVLLGYFMGVEVGIPFVVALLTILGYSVNDTIVVFDRIREKIIKRGSDKFDETVNIGVNETLVRSVNTSITTLIVLFGLFLFGGESIKYFALALIIGIALGTYSSIFLASPLLVVWEQYKKNN